MWICNMKMERVCEGLGLVRLAQKGISLSCVIKTIISAWLYKMWEIFWAGYKIPASSVGRGCLAFVVNKCDYVLISVFLMTLH